MKLKGDLDSIGLAELFKTLADQKATGLLSVDSAMGEKQIALAQGEIAVYSDRLAERARIGDLLVARGKLSDSQLNEALKAQKATPRIRLGDLLLKLKYVTAQDISDALRFQLEEEIYDLFTWKGGTFEFDGEKMLEEESESNKNVHRLLIKPDSLIAEATRRISEWTTIESRLPTPYLCFKISPKGEELSDTAPAGMQRVLRLLKEGRTIETTVKRSCMGRLAVSKSIIKLLDDGWIFPYPAADLPLLAAEHRAQKRYSDALNIYRRMLESTDDEAEKAELNELIASTIDAIHQAKDSGETPEGMEIFSHKLAADRYMRRRLYRRFALFAVAGIAIAFALYTLIGRYSPAKQLPEAYQAAIRDADTAMDSGKVDLAIDIWQKFYKSLPDKESDTAMRVQERLRNLPKRFDTFVENQLLPIERLEKQNKLDEAMAGYNQLIEKFPDNHYLDRMKEGLARVKRSSETQQLAKALSTLEGKLKEARSLFKNKKYTPAKAIFTEVSSAAPAGTDPRREADDSLKQLDQIEERSRINLGTAETSLLEQNAEHAIEAFNQAAAEWPDLPTAKQAHEQSQRLAAKLNVLKDAIKDADLAQVDGRILDALAALTPLDHAYSEFKTSAELRKRIIALNEQVAQIDKQIAEAQAAARGADRQNARQLFTALMVKQPQFLAARNTEVPVRLETRPKSGAIVRIDGKEAGRSPCELMLPVAKAFTITLEMPGYATEEKKFTSLSSQDLEMQITLRRMALLTIDLSVKDGVLARPKVINGSLYVLHGDSLSVFDLTGKKLWTREHLPLTGKANPDVMTANSLCAFTAGSILLTTASRDVFTVSATDQNPVKILTLPEDPSGTPYIVPDNSGSRALIAVPCADGMIRAYDPARAFRPEWERPIDPADKTNGKIAAGLAPRTNNSFLALSYSGRLSAFNALDGQVNTVADVKRRLASGNTLPSDPSQSVAALVHADGKVSAIDLIHGTTIWELAVEQAMDEAFSAVASKKSVFVLTRDGRVSSYGLSSDVKPVWTRNLDGASEIPMSVDSALYVACNSGHLYALSPDTGHVLWDYRMEGKPLHLCAADKYVYVMTTSGKLIVLSSE